MPISTSKSSIQQGIFPYLVNIAAFVDTLIGNINWAAQPTTGNRISIVRNVATGSRHSGSLYGRRLDAILLSTGNPIHLWYGRQLSFHNILRMRMMLRSEQIPLTGMQLCTALHDLTGWNGEDVAFSRVEFTCDVSGYSVPALMKQCFSRSHRFIKLRDASGRSTFYFGGRRSPFQLCVYQKSPRICRIEFILRRNFLRNHDIVEPVDVLTLPHIDFSKNTQFQEIDLKEILKVLPPTVGWAKEAQDLFLEGRYQAIVKLLSEVDGISCAPFLSDAPVEKVLRRMRKNLVW